MARTVTPTRKPDSDRPDLRSAGLLLAIPSLLIAAPLIGFFLGKFADGKLHTTPWLTLVGVVLGFVGVCAWLRVWTERGSVAGKPEP